MRVFFETDTFDRITKDKSVDFVDMLSSIGGTMGLLTGFSLISAVEIVSYATKFLGLIFNQAVKYILKKK